jgi:hypothetical protein
MNDDTILVRITRLVEREHQLRARSIEGTAAGRSIHAELHAMEVQLDQFWDLLRQRRAKRDFGGDPDQADIRSESVVENYWQ